MFFEISSRRVAASEEGLRSSIAASMLPRYFHVGVGEGDIPPLPIAGVAVVAVRLPLLSSMSSQRTPPEHFAAASSAVRDVNSIAALYAFHFAARAHDVLVFASAPNPSAIASPADSAVAFARHTFRAMRIASSDVDAQKCSVAIDVGEVNAGVTHHPQPQADGAGPQEPLPVVRALRMLREDVHWRCDVIFSVSRLRHRPRHCNPRQSRRQRPHRRL